MEYFQHLLDLMGRAERTAGSRLGDLGSGGATPDDFRFGVETRIQVTAAHVLLQADVGTASAQSDICLHWRCSMLAPDASVQQLADGW